LKIDAGRVPDSTLLDVPSEATGQAALKIDAGRVPDSALGSAPACNPAPTCPAGWFLNASKICSCTLGGVCSSDCRDLGDGLCYQPCSTNADCTDARFPICGFVYKGDGLDYASQKSVCRAANQAPVCPSGDGCARYDGENIYRYSVGQGYADLCRSCTCTAPGVLDCTDSCVVLDGGTKAVTRWQPGRYSLQVSSTSGDGISNHEFTIEVDCLGHLSGFGFTTGIDAGTTPTELLTDIAFDGKALKFQASYTWRNYTWYPAFTVGVDGTLVFQDGYGSDDINAATGTWSWRAITMCHS